LRFARNASPRFPAFQSGSSLLTPVYCFVVCAFPKERHYNLFCVFTPIPVPLLKRHMDLELVRREKFDLDFQTESLLIGLILLQS
jgi:hypothetical protein